MAVKSPRHTGVTRETNVTGETKVYRFQYRTRTRVACFALAFCLISLPMPTEFAIDVLTWPVSLIRRKLKPVKQTAVQETPVDRVGHVSSIRITPPKHVGRQGQSIALRGLPLDSSGRIIDGVRISYASSNTAILTVDSGSGVATLLRPGVVWVNATAGAVTARAPILVLAGSRAMQTDAQWDADQAMLNPDGKLATGVGSNGLIPSLLEKLAPTVHAQTGGGDSGDFGYDELWSTPANLVGHPRNRVAEQTNIGTVLPEGSNFNISIPIYSAPGRAVPVSFGLNYNSRLWSRHGNAVTFNAVNTWPYLGFTLGFGRIVTYGSDANTKFLLIDPDGTRHYLGSGPSSQTNTYQTNDGTHITYVGSATSGGTLYYTNGRNVTFYPVNNRLLPVSINDTNGNSVSVSYMTFGQPQNCNTGAGFQWRTAINYIYDSLGRVVQFNYDSCNNLVSITATRDRRHQPESRHRHAGPV